MNNKSEIIENTKKAINTLRKFADTDAKLNNSKGIEIEYKRALNILESRLVRARAKSADWSE